MTGASPGGWNWFWAALVLVGLIVFIGLGSVRLGEVLDSKSVPYQTASPSKMHWSFDQMIDICKSVAGQAHRAAGPWQGEQAYDDCMTRILRESR